jgi:hypothetical protein
MREVVEYIRVSVPVALSTLHTCVVFNITLCYSILHDSIQRSISVNFLGEGSIDVGGPYRDAITQMCGDLMSDTCSLFRRAPNRRNDVGLNREK